MRPERVFVSDRCRNICAVAPQLETEAQVHVLLCQLCCDKRVLNKPKKIKGHFCRDLARAVSERVRASSVANFPEVTRETIQPSCVLVIWHQPTSSAPEVVL